MHFICLLKPPALNDLWEMTRVPSWDSSTDSVSVLFTRIPTNTKNVFSHIFYTILPWGVKDYVEQPMWKLVVSSANISCNFFFYHNFPWFFNLGGGNCTDESQFPVLFSVMVHQNYCQHNVRLELEWAFTFLCFVTVYWCVTDIRIRKEVCGCIYLL